MNKRFSRILSLAIALLMCMAMAAPAMAATPFTYSAVSATSTSFYKYLVLDSTAKVPAVTFSFTAVAMTEAELAGVQTGFPVYPGVGTATVTAATFTAGQTTFDAKQTGDTVSDLNGRVYAKEQVTVTFSNATFNEPGVYRYKITEDTPTGVNANGITPDSDPQYLDVYVTDNGSGTLVITGYVLHTDNSSITRDATNMGTGDVAATGNELATKSGGFENDYTTYDLTFEKTVTGNQGSRDKYFKFTVSINNAAPGTYTVDITGAEANPTASASTNSGYTSMENKNTIVVGATGSATQIFYLQHGQKIKIQDLSSGATYTITEDKEDYKIASIARATTDTDTDGVSDTTAGTYTDGTTGITADTTVTFTNERTGTIPTGVLLTIAPFAALLVIGFVGVVLIMKKRKN